MSFNGSGLFVIDSTGQPVSANTLIQASVFNALTADLATALSTAICKDGQTTITANLPMAGYRHTGVGNASARTMYSAAAQIQDGSLCYGTVGGTADVITLTLVPAITAYVAGQKFSFLSSGANTGAVTINVSTVAAKAITKNGTTALAAGEIPSGAICVIEYDGTQFQLINVKAASTAANTFTGLQTFAAGADIATATTVDLTAATGNLVRITGTTATTGVTINNGQVVSCYPTGAWPLTYHATNMPIKGGASYTCAAGDTVIFSKDGNGTLHVDIVPVALHPAIVSQVAAEAGTDTTARLWTAERVGQAIAALAATSGGLPQNYITGLTLANNATDATNDIDIAIGSARDSTNAADIVLASALVKRLDAAWAVGTNQGGLDTGSIADGTYHVWLIQRSDTGVEDVLFSTSATAPTMPTNYDYKRRIGSILRESAAIVLFVQDDSEFMRKASILDVAATNPGTGAVTRTLSVPTGIRVKALLNAAYKGPSISVAEAAYLSDLSITDVSPSISAAPLGQMQASYGTTDTIYIRGHTSCAIWTNTSAQIRSRVAANGGDILLSIATLGWTDLRGRNG